MNTSWEDYLWNGTDIYLIDKAYKPHVEALGINFEGLMNFNASEYLLNWNISNFKKLLPLFVAYHNMVAEKVGNSSNSTEELANKPEGWD